MYIVGATVNDVGGSGITIGKFETFQEALQTLLNLDPWDFTPELTEMWIRTPDRKILTGPWDPLAKAHGLEIEVRCHCGAHLVRQCSRCTSLPPTYVVTKKVI